MRGNEIIVSANPRGRKVEGIIGAAFTPKPGTVVQVDASIALIGGVQTWKQFTRSADGDRPAGPLILLCADALQGKTAADAYAAGDRAFGFIPAAGDEVNVLLLDIAGTADDHTKGEVLIVKNSSGKLIATTGSPQSQPFLLLETVTDPVADTLAWAMCSGY